MKAVCVLSCGLLFWTTSLAAHHSFAAEYDATKPVTLSGIVARIDWTNPHIHFYVDVKDEAGSRHAVEVRRLSAEHARPAGLEAGRHAEAGRRDYRVRLACARRSEPRRRARGHVRRRTQDGGRAARWHGRTVGSSRRRSMSTPTCRRRAWRIAVRRCVPGSRSAQARRPTEPQPIPRAADGKPDLSGIWITGALALLIGEESRSAIQKADAAAGRTAPPREPPPYKPAAEAQRQDYLARRGIDDPMARCLLSGVPRITIRPLPFQIVQMPDRSSCSTKPITVPHHADRRPSASRRCWSRRILGIRSAHWEGDTLVVDVTSFNDKTWLAGVGTIHSEKLHVTERYTRDSLRHDSLRRDHGRSRGVHEAVAPARDVQASSERAASRIRVHREQRRSARFEKLLQTDPALRKP